MRLRRDSGPASSGWNSGDRVLVLMADSWKKVDA
jgi:hypothetical protein